MTRKNPANGTFDGPLFLIGMPRSGTKLLGTLLNQSPRIEISTLETDFLPYWFDRWDSYGDLSDRRVFAAFYREAEKLPYFINLRNYDRLVTDDNWYGACPDFTAAGVFEALIRLETGATVDTGKVWGDKSPSYTRHLGMLQDHFRSARFIHIVRDVRDYCLSNNNAWGKNMIRAAQRWTDDVAAACAAGKRHPESYVEVRYEDLLEDPDSTMERLCAFLDVEFDAVMTKLSRPTERVGDARDAKIKKDNVQKYVDKMKPDTRRTIEAIAGSVLRDLGYPVVPGASPKRIGKLRMMIYQISDALGVFRSSMGEKGFWGSLWFNARSLLTKR